MHTDYSREIQLDLDFTVRRPPSDLEAWIGARIERAPAKRLAALDITMAFLAERNGGIVLLDGTVLSVACEAAQVIDRLFGKTAHPAKHWGGRKWLRKTFAGLAFRQTSPASPSACGLRRPPGVGESALGSPPAPPLRLGGPETGGGL